jgi:hypothetical protein
VDTSNVVWRAGRGRPTLRCIEAVEASGSEGENRPGNRLTHFGGPYYNFLDDGLPAS